MLFGTPGNRKDPFFLYLAYPEGVEALEGIGVCPSRSKLCTSTISSLNEDLSSSEFVMWMNVNTLLAYKMGN